MHRLPAPPQGGHTMLSYVCRVLARLARAVPGRRHDCDRCANTGAEPTFQGYGVVPCLACRGRGGAE